VLEYAKKKGVPVETQTFLSPDKLFSNIDEDGLFDILFLDIELDDITGIDVGNRLRSDLKNEIMQIVFISANDEYALQLFNIRPMNFLVKPITYDKVSFIMDEYDRLFPASNRYIQYKKEKM
jgi:two-component SAPR family response regulator